MRTPSCKLAGRSSAGASADSRTPAGPVRGSAAKSPAARASPYARTPGASGTVVLSVDDDAGASVATGTTHPLRQVFHSLGFEYEPEPEPRWVLPRAIEEFVQESVREAAQANGLRLVVRDAAEVVEDRKVVRTPPKCKHHGVPCVIRTAGAGAMPHNRGRRFWACPKSSKETQELCTWMWEDGTLPFSAASQRRFDSWLDSQGGGGGCRVCHAMAAIGLGCPCDCCD